MESKNSQANIYPDRFQISEDYYQIFWTSNFIRLIRIDNDHLISHLTSLRSFDIPYICSVYLLRTRMISAYVCPFGQTKNGQVILGASLQQKQLCTTIWSDGIIAKRVKPRFCSRLPNVGYIAFLHRQVWICVGTAASSLGGTLKLSIIDKYRV